MTLEELKALYAEKGATTRREEETEQGTQTYIDPIAYGSGWSAYEDQPIIGYEGSGENATPIYGDKVLGGFSQNKDGINYFYDTEGNFKGAEKDGTSFYERFGPMIMAAMTMGGGSAALGSYLFPSLSGAAAAGAGGALVGGANAALTDQDILKGALKGGVGSAGALKLGDTGFTLGDVNKAINFAQNPSLAGAANLASPYIPNVNVGSGSISLNDVLKGVGTAKDLSSGDYSKIFKAITGMAGDQGKSLKSSLSGFDVNPDDFIEGYFKPGGEGYIDPNREEMTVREDPEGIDAFLRSLSPYATDSGKSIFTQSEDIPEMETVAKRPKSLTDILGMPDILKTAEADIPELTITDNREKEYVPGLRTKEIKSDIPDEITVDQITKLFPDLDINSILQTVPTTVTPTKTVTPATKTTTPATTTSQQQGANQIGLLPSEDPYADIKYMEELFGRDMAYKLKRLGMDNKQQPASANIDALAKLLRG
jgi:hypothetical protein